MTRDVLPFVESVHVLFDTTVELRFRGGTTRIIDLRPLMTERPFQEVFDRKWFARVRADREFGGIEWPNGADISPEALWEASVQVGFREPLGKGNLDKLVGAAKAYDIVGAHGNLRRYAKNDGIYRVGRTLKPAERAALRGVRVAPVVSRASGHFISWDAVAPEDAHVIEAPKAPLT